MLTLFTIISNNDFNYFQKTLPFLKQLDYYDNCQKLIFTNINLNWKDSDFTIIENPRKIINCKQIWDIILNISENEKIVYIPPFSILPKDYLSNIHFQIKNNYIISSGNTYKINSKDIDFVKNKESNNLIKDLKVYPPSKLKEIYNKCYLSDTFGINKKTYLNSGGFSIEFEGLEYTDYDYYMQCFYRNIAFKFIDRNEFYLSRKINDTTLDIIKCWNGLRLCTKWGLNPSKELNILKNKYNINENMIKESVLFYIDKIKYKIIL